MRADNRPKPITIPAIAGASRHGGRIFARVPDRGLQARTDGTRREILVYDEIGPGGITAAGFRKELIAARGGDLTVRINSPGGSVFDGIAIYNDLVAHRGNVRVEISGIAASIASVIAMAGDTVAIAPTAFTMVHKPWSFVVGTDQDMIKEAAILNKLEGAIVDVYHARIGGDRKAIENWVAAETWFKADQAMALGFADEELPEGKSDTVAFNVADVFNNVPADLATVVPPARTNDITTRADLERALRDRLGFSNSNARRVALGGFSALHGADADRVALTNLVTQINAATERLAA